MRLHPATRTSRRDNANACEQSEPRTACSAFASGAGPFSPRKSAPQVLQDFAGAVVAGRTSDAAARVRAGTTQVQSLHRRAVVSVAEQRTGRPQLVERQR